jgi:hypothetical protein
MSPVALFRDNDEAVARNMPMHCGGTERAKRLIILLGRSVTNPLLVEPIDLTRKEVPGRLRLCMVLSRG